MYKPGKCLLRSLLKKSNIKQIDLARKTGIRRQQISEYVNGRRIMTLQNAATIAMFFGVDALDLYEWEKIDRDED